MILANDFYDFLRKSTSQETKEMTEKIQKELITAKSPIATKVAVEKDKNFNIAIDRYLRE